MKKIKRTVAKNAGELAEVLGLTRADGIEFAVRSALNTKIIDVVEKKRLTHAQVATLADTSRSRVTAIMNRNTKGISTDLMLRVLGALGVSAKVTFGRAAQRLEEKKVHRARRHSRVGPGRQRNRRRCHRRLLDDRVRRQGDEVRHRRLWK